MSENKKGGRALIALYVDPRDKELWAVLAKRHGISLPGFIRMMMRDRLAQEGYPVPTPAAPPS